MGRLVWLDSVVGEVRQVGGGNLSGRLPDRSKLEVAVAGPA